MRNPFKDGFFVREEVFLGATHWMLYAKSAFGGETFLARHNTAEMAALHLSELEAKYGNVAAPVETRSFPGEVEFIIRTGEVERKIPLKAFTMESTDEPGEMRLTALVRFTVEMEKLPDGMYRARGIKWEGVDPAPLAERVAEGSDTGRED